MLKQPSPITFLKPVKIGNITDSGKDAMLYLERVQIKYCIWALFPNIFQVAKGSAYLHLWGKKMLCGKSVALCFKAVSFMVTNRNTGFKVQLDDNRVKRERRVK